jgi:hypothetical protein
MPLCLMCIIWSSSVTIVMFPVQPVGKCMKYFEDIIEFQSTYAAVALFGRSLCFSFYH